MNNANYRISLDMHDNCSQISLTARKGENGRSIIATLTENGRPYVISAGCRATFACLKPDGKKLENECVIEKNTIRYDLTKRTVISTGIVECEFRLMDGAGRLLASPKFRIEVYSTILNDGDAVETENVNVNTVKSANPGYSEVFMWSDGNPKGEDRVGLFVGSDMEKSASMVRICDSTSDVRGVCVVDPGFASNAPGNRFDDNSILRHQFCFVGLLGFAPVIDHGTCSVNGRCRSGDDGTAVPDDSGGGYLVAERLDEEHVLIILEQAADMMVRVNNQMGRIRKTFKTVISTFWAGTKAPFTQEIQLPGILGNDSTRVGLLKENEYELDLRQRKEFGLISNIQTYDDKIVVEADGKTNVDISVQVESCRFGYGVRGEHGEAFICRGGDGANRSCIIVTAPVGSNVTCSMGSDTKTAAEENGTWTFYGCDVGIWTVTATNGVNTASKTVEIKEDMQLMRYYITLFYFTATIVATYPVGAVCTCTNGTETLTATDASGRHVFTVHEPGDWTISYSVAGGTKSVAVAIDDEKEYKVVLSYLYKSGDECEAVTGGWAGRGWGRTSSDVISKAPTVTKKEDCIECNISSTSSTASTVIEMQNDIDVTPYNTLFCEWKAVRNEDMIGVIDRTSKYCGGTDCAAYGNPETLNEKIVTAVDISGVSGPYDIFLGVRSNAGTSRTIVLYNLWLE